MLNGHFVVSELGAQLTAFGLPDKVDLCNNYEQFFLHVGAVYLANMVRR